MLNKAKGVGNAFSGWAGRGANTPEITFKANFRQWFGLLRGKAKPNVVEMRFRAGQVGDLPHGITFKANFRQCFIPFMPNKANRAENTFSAWAGRGPAPREITFKANSRQWFIPPSCQTKPNVFENTLSAWAGREPAPRNFGMASIGTLRLKRGCQKNENRHRPAPFLGGPSEVFRIVDDHAASNHETLPRNRFLLHCHPFGRQWAVTPKLTMIAVRQLSIGALSV
jgi:hypothetical protein